MIRKLVHVVSVLSAVLLFVAPAALAALPTPGGAIKVPTSLGGVKLGMKIVKADKAWGKKGECESFSGGFKRCQYQKGTDTSAGYAEITSVENSKVNGARIQVGQRDGEDVFSGPLMKFETKAGIGLGDKASKIKKAYPKAKSLGTDLGYYVDGKRGAQMVFETSGGKRITRIGISDGSPG